MGADWYSEQWPDTRRETDLRTMEAAYLNIVRVAEFAWSHPKRILILHGSIARFVSRKGTIGCLALRHHGTGSAAFFLIACPSVIS